jgi:drug/metabolite transporter (DMT)-like permease
MTADAWRRRAVAIGARWDAVSPIMRGILWTLFGGFIFSVMSVLVKLLGTRLDSFQIAFIRAAFGFASVLPFAIAAGSRTLRTNRLPAHFYRSLVGALGMLCSIYSIVYLPLADSSAYSYTRPLFLIVLAVLFLGETIRMRRVTATILGFAGVLVMLRPQGGIAFAALLGLLGSFFGALVSIFIKQLSETEKPVSVLFYFGLISTVLTLIPALLVWRQPTLEELVMLMAIGATGAGGQRCMIRGYAVADATAVAAYDYVRLIYAIGFGLIIFREVPDLRMLSGAAIVVASTLYIAHREAKLGKRPPPPMPMPAGVAPVRAPGASE